MSQSIPTTLPSDPRLAILVDSYARLTGRSLITAGGDLYAKLWNAPAVIVAHGTETDPIFFYGNQLALMTFDMNFEAFTQMPSRLSAEPLARDEREFLLQRVSRDGFIDDYAGVRVSSTGKRFRIEQAVVWNLIDADGKYHGQAATFSQWTTLS